MENILVALSNVPSIFPIYQAHKNNDIVTLSCISFVSVFSFLSHLVENHKHGMPGIGISPKISYILNRLDVLGCIFAVSRFGKIFLSDLSILKSITNDKHIMIGLPLVLASSVISEYDKYNPKLKHRYVLFHCLWHIGIFYQMNRVLSNHVYI